MAGVPGAITFRDQRDIPLIRQLRSQVESGRVRTIAFALPPRYGWPLSMYELALMSAKHASERGLTIETVLVTPEPAPLTLFGRQASGVVRTLLERHGVRFVGEAIAVRAQGDGSLTLESGKTVEADRVVAAPELRARSFTGVPAGRWGFVPVDQTGGVLGLEDVYAAGDATAFPIKAGGLAAQQADVVAQRIAASLGVVVKEVRAPHVLHARLLGGESPVFLRTEFDWTAQPTRATLVRAGDEDAAKTAKGARPLSRPLPGDARAARGPSGGLKPGRRASG